MMTMSLEQAIAENTAAVKELAAALKAAATAAGDAGATTTKSAKDTKTAKETTSKTKAYEPKYTKAQAQAAANEVKETKGVPAAKALIADLGYAKLAEIEKPEDIDKLYEAAKALLGEGAEAGADDNI